MWKIRFHIDSRGSSPIKEFFLSLSTKEKAKIYYELKLLENYGFKLGMPHAKPIQGKLWELRPGKNRLLYFAHINNEFVILHGFRKKTNKTPKKEIEIALKRMREYLE